LRVDTREVVRDDPKLRPTYEVDQVARFIGSLRLDVTQAPALDVPSIVPPVSFKPVMSCSQLRTWVAADDLLQRAGSIVIVGYSFATADEHFNDLLRHANPTARVLVVNTNPLGPTRAACRILGLDSQQLVLTQIRGLNVAHVGRLCAVTARADQIDDVILPELLKSIS